MAEALRRYRERSAGSGERDQQSQPGLGPFRLAQLESDVKLTPEQRVRAAEQMARLAQLASPRSPRRFVIQFDRYEDYLEWKRHEAAGA